MPLLHTAPVLTVHGGSASHRCVRVASGRLDQLRRRVHTAEWRLTHSAFEYSVLLHRPHNTFVLLVVPFAKSASFTQPSFSTLTYYMAVISIPTEPQH